MAEFLFECVGAAPQRHAAGPTLEFRLRLQELSGTRVHAIALRCQIRIEPQRRRYDGEDAELLAPLFGTPDRWGDTMKPFQLATASTVVGSFTSAVEVSLPVPFSYDLDVTAGQYFHALRDGVVPLELLFSGTVFGVGESGFLVEQVPWHHAAPYRMPVAVWRDMMDRYFPGDAILRLHRSTVDDLQRYRVGHALPTWDATVESLLQHAAEGSGP